MYFSFLFFGVFFFFQSATCSISSLLSPKPKRDLFIGSYWRWIGNSNLSVGACVSANGCLSLCGCTHQTLQEWNNLEKVSQASVLPSATVTWQHTDPLRSATGRQHLTPRVRTAVTVIVAAESLSLSVCLFCPLNPGGATGPPASLCISLMPAACGVKCWQRIAHHHQNTKEAGVSACTWSEPRSVDARLLPGCVYALVFLLHKKKITSSTKGRKWCLVAGTIAGSSWIRFVSRQMSSIEHPQKEKNVPRVWTLCIGQRAEQVDWVKSPGGENDKLWRHLKKRLQTPFLLFFSLLCPRWGMCTRVKKENGRADGDKDGDERPARLSTSCSSNQLSNTLKPGATNTKKNND